MMRSTTKSKRRTLLRAGAVLFWLLVWQTASALIGQEILLVSPVSVFQALAGLAATGAFWLSILYSFGKIMLGFLLAQLVGALLAALSCRVAAVRELLYPLVAAVKATPVASFVILALIWVSSQNLSVLISFLMSFPIVYQNLLEGFSAADRKLVEMARVFRMGRLRRALYLYLPAAMPFFVSSVSLSVGLCWKSGIAAEVIGQPARSIGGALYEAKIFYDTSGMFAWTLVIILISVAFEKAALWLIGRAQRRLEAM